MPPMVRLLFEVADLAQASPATVSRAGMVSWRDFLQEDGEVWDLLEVSYDVSITDFLALVLGDIFVISLTVPGGSNWK